MTGWHSPPDIISPVFAIDWHMTATVPRKAGAGAAATACQNKPGLDIRLGPTRLAVVTLLHDHETGHED